MKGKRSPGERYDRIAARVSRIDPFDAERARRGLKALRNGYAAYCKLNGPISLWIEVKA